MSRALQLERVNLSFIQVVQVVPILYGVFLYIQQKHKNLVNPHKKSRFSITISNHLISLSSADFFPCSVEDNNNKKNHKIGRVYCVDGKTKDFQSLFRK